MIGNLVDLQLTANADGFASGTQATSVSGTDGGGAVQWRDVSAMTRYGVLDDQSLALTAPNYAEQRRAAYQIVANKVSTSSIGAKTAIVLRDADTADKWRELDRVTVNDAELGINRLGVRIVGYTFSEGQVTQSLTLDQFSEDDPTLLMKRTQQATFQVAVKFGNRS